VSGESMFDRLRIAIGQRAAAAGDVRTALGFDRRTDLMAVPSPIADAAEPQCERTTVYVGVDAGRVRGCGARVGDRLAGAHHALADLRTLTADPTTTRAALDAGVGELVRTLAQARRSDRAVAGELAEIEESGRMVVAAAFDARTRGRLR